MSSEWIEPALALFREACELPEDERAAFLDCATGEDAELRRHVEAMLAQDDREHAGIDTPLVPHGVRTALSDLARQAESDADAESTPQTIGAYRIIEELGYGAQARVYLAEHETLHRRVALKVLRAPVTDGSSRSEQRFRREAEVTASIEHPNICSVYETGCSQGATWIAMQYVPGSTLAAHLAQHRDAASKVATLHLPANDTTRGVGSGTPSSGAAMRSDLMRVVAFAEQAARALHVAHEYGLVHRDIKPGNLMVADEGRPVILDFGLAHASDGDGSQGRLDLTRSQDVLGTPYYMAPEQLRAGYVVDGRTDVYALGVTLFECLTGQCPFEAVSVEALYQQILTVEPPGPRTLNPVIPKDLEVVLLTAIEKERDRRYQTALDFAEDLRRVRQYEPIRARPISTWGRVVRLARRRPGMAVSLSIAALSLVAGLVASLHFGMSEAEQRRASERETYRVTIRAAGFEVEAGRLDSAQRSLDGTNAELRDWEWHYLRGRRDRGAQMLTGPEAPIWYAGFVHGTPLVLGVDGKSVAHLWDRTTQATKTVRLADERDEDTSARLPMAVRADGVQVLTRTMIRKPEDKPRTVAVLWETTTGQILQRFAVDGLVSDNAGASAISPTGAHVALGAGPLRLYEVDSGRLIEGHGYYERACAFSADGKWLVFAFGTDVRFRRVEADRWAGRDINAAPSRGESDHLQELALSPDHSLLVTCTANTVQVWDLANGKCLHRQLGPAGRVTNIGFSPDGSRLVAHSDAFRVFDPRSGRLLRTLPAHGEHGNARFGFDSAGTTLAVGHRQGRDHGVRLFALEGHAALVLTGHAGQVERVAISPDGRIIASASLDGEVRLWDAETSECFAVLHGTQLAMNRWGSASTVPSGLAFDPSGERLVLASGAVEVWDTATGEHLRRFEKGYASAFSPDGSLLLLGCVNRLDVCDGRTFEPRTELGARCGEIEFSPDGAFFATASGRTASGIESQDRGTGISVFRTRTLEKELDIVTQWPMVSLSYSPDGSWIAGGDARGNLTVFDVTGRRLGSAPAHGGAVFAVRFLSPRRIASGGGDGVIRIWDVSSDDGEPRLVLELRGHVGSVLSLAFSPDGQRLVSASADGNIRVWETHPITRRLDARGAAARVRSRAERLACRLLDDEGRARRVVEKLRSEAALDPVLRQEALHAVLRHRELEYEGLVPGTAEAARARPDNKVIELDGKSALSVDFRSALHGLRTFTLECWVRGETPKGCGALMSNYKKSGFAIYARGHPGDLEFTFPGGMVNLETTGWEFVRTRNPWQWKKWTHVAICYDEEALTLFVDGKPVDSLRCSGPIDRSEFPFFVGAAPGPMGSRHFFTGLVDEVRVSRVARYRDAFQPVRVHETDDDTLLLLHFDAEVRGFYPDDSGKRHHAWPIGKPRLVNGK